MTNWGFNKKSLNLSMELIPGRDGYRLKERVFYHDRESSIKVCAEKEFVCDMGSIPSLAKVIASNDDHRLRRPCLLHDWCYRHRGRLAAFTFNSKMYPRVKLTRAQIDKIFYNMLRSENVSTLKSVLMYLAVRVGGWVSWK